jgi:hypothetical protein
MACKNCALPSTPDGRLCSYCEKFKADLELKDDGALDEFVRSRSVTSWHDHQLALIADEYRKRGFRLPA